MEEELAEQARRRSIPDLQPFLRPRRLQPLADLNTECDRLSDATVLPEQFYHPQTMLIKRAVRSP